MNNKKYISPSFIQLKSLILIVLSFALSCQGVFSMESTETLEEEIEFYCEQSHDENVPKEQIKIVMPSEKQDVFHQDDFYRGEFVKSCFYKLFILYCNMSIDFKANMQTT